MIKVRTCPTNGNCKQRLRRLPLGAYSFVKDFDRFFLPGKHRRLKNFTGSN
jgi:hypothetical protein